ncbi:MAG: universal stress protein [Chloroflexi bacterium]|nr:universal stress protein [Chloroflexota bacterium]
MDTQYRRILLPLDGSGVAKSAVATAAAMSRMFNSELLLVTVLHESVKLPRSVAAGSGSSDSEVEGVAGSEQSARSTAASYLEQLAKDLRETGVHASCATVVNTDPASEIVLTARDRGAQMIVMASRGRSGLVRGLLGSVTDRVIHSSPIPVMVVPADGGHNADGWTPQSIIAPLDGSELAETALPHVESISRAANIPITLVRAVPFPTTYGGDPYGGLPAGLFESAAEDEKEAKRYLSTIATRLRARGRIIETHVSNGHPRSEITQIAQDTSDSIVVMTTRGVSGLTRWVVGSIADSVVRSSGVPVLVIPPTTGI